MLRVGVIGLGDISQVHIPIINGLETVSLAAVCDLDRGKKARRFKESISTRTIWRCWKMRISTASIFACRIICTPGLP